MPSPLETLLDDQQRDRLSDFIEQRILSIDSQLNNLREKRKRYFAQMNDDFEWRRGGDGAGVASRDRWFNNRNLDDWAEEIFDLQNDSLNIVGGFAAFMTARTVDDIFGTKPYFHIYGEGPLDKSVAETLQKHTEWKIERSPWPDAALDSIDLAVGLGEGIIKQSWDTETDIYETLATVLYDTAKKMPVQTQDGQYLYETDPHESVSANDATGAAFLGLVFQKSPLEVFNASTLIFREMAIEQTNVSYSNIRASTVNIDDFLCPENEPSLKDSSFVGHRIQRRLSYLIERYDLDEDTIAEFKSDTYDAKTAEAKPNEILKEQEDSFSDYENPDPLIELVECWMRHDPVGDRRQRRIYVLFAVKSKKLIAMDYIANKTPNGELPFHVVRAFRVKNRWWGRGYYEIYEKAQEFIDRHLNYVAYRNRFHSNPVTFFDDSVLFEDEESEDLELRPGAGYRLKAGYKKEDCVQLLELPDLDDRTWQLLQMMIQVVQVRSGVTSAAQGEVSSLPSTATATGIESILQSAGTLARMPMNEIKGDLEESMLYSVKLIHANMNPVESFAYFDGDEKKIAELQSLQVRDIEMNIRLLLTRFKDRERAESALKGIEVMQSYLAIPEPEKGPLRSMYLQYIKGLGFDDANTIVRPPIMLDPLTGQPIVPGMAPMLPAPQEQPAP